MNKAANTRRLLIVTVFIWLELFTTITDAVAGEPATYLPQVYRLRDAADAKFVELGICTEKPNDCRHKEIFFWSVNSDGIAIELWQLDIEVVHEIFHLCLAEYKRNEQMMEIRVEVFDKPHKEMMDHFFPWSVPKPIIKLTMKGKGN